MRLDTADKRLAARFIPPNSVLMPHPRGESVAVVYVKDSTEFCTRPSAVAYIGTAARPRYNYSFRDAANRDKWIADFFAGIESHQQRKAEYKAERDRPHTLKVGDIITNSWGYDQTNVDWYRVARTTAHYVWLQPIAAKLTEDGGVGPMSGRTVAALDANGQPCDLNKPEEKHKASAYQHGSSVCFEFGSGSKWDGRPMFTSWYA